MAVAKSKKASAIKAVEKRIVPIEDAEPYIQILLYGRHGKGKTRIAATAPNVLVLDINEKGTRSARGPQYKGAKVYPVKKWEDITYVYWYLKSGNHDYDSYAIDSLTGMQHMCLQHVLGEAEDRDPNREPSMPDRRTWGKLAELMKPMILNFRNLPMHGVFTALERTIGDEDEGEPVVHVPDLTPGSRGVAMAAVDVIGRVYQKEVRTTTKQDGKKKVTKRWETRMLVGPHDEFETKDRTGALGRVMSKPTIPQIIAAGIPPEEEEDAA